MELSLVQKNKFFPNCLLSIPTEEFSTLIRVQELWLLEKYLMEGILPSMLAHSQASSLKIIISPFQEELLLTDCLFTWTHILCITLSDHLAQLKFWLHTVVIKDMGFICLSLQEPTTDIVAVLQVKADRQLRQNFKKQTLANWQLNKHLNMSLKCKI